MAFRFLLINSKAWAHLLPARRTLFPACSVLHLILMHWAEHCCLRCWEKMPGLQLGTEAGPPPHLWDSGSLSTHSTGSPHGLSGPVLLSGGHMDPKQSEEVETGLLFWCPLSPKQERMKGQQNPPKLGNTEGKPPL